VREEVFPHLVWRLVRASEAQIFKVTDRLTLYLVSATDSSTLKIITYSDR